MTLSVVYFSCGKGVTRFWTEEEMRRLGTDLLETFRDVCRYNTCLASDTAGRLLSYGEGAFSGEDTMRETIVRLEFFAGEMERKRYEEALDRIFQTDYMLRVMEILKMKVYSFSDYGPEFVSILDLCYMNSFDYGEGEILEELCMGRSTFYKKKKRAVTLFGLAFLGWRTETKGRFSEDYPKSMRTLTLEAVLEGMAEFYSRELSQKITRGLHETALKCQTTGGPGLLGYRMETRSSSSTRRRPRS